MTGNPSISRRLSWPSFGLWVGLTIIGFLFGGFTIHISPNGPTTPFILRDLDPFAALIGFLFGAVTGLIIASLQWVVLKSWIPNGRTWILLNMVGFGLAHAMDDALPYRALDLSLSLMMGGSLVGLAQSIALRHALPKAFLWVPVAAFAWFLGFQLGFACLNVSGISKNPLVGIVIVFGTAGLVIGAITGIAIRLMTADNLASGRTQPVGELSQEYKDDLKV